MRGVVWVILLQVFATCALCSSPREQVSWWSSLVSSVTGLCLKVVLQWYPLIVYRFAQTLSPTLWAGSLYVLSQESLIVGYTIAGTPKSRCPSPRDFPPSVSSFVRSRRCTWVVLIPLNLSPTYSTAPPRLALSLRTGFLSHLSCPILRPPLWTAIVILSSPVPW